jgi:ABC-type cobalt transport system substrate-binding protein
MLRNVILYTCLSQNSSDDKVKTSVPFTNFLLNCYLDLVILELRKNGALESFEGIRIVKELKREFELNADTESTVASMSADPINVQSGADCCASEGVNTGAETRCCSKISPPAPIFAPWITSRINTPSGIIPQISTRLTFQDTLGAWKARWSLGRMNYKVPPGLYTVGNPGANSPVLVSANYKMSFDRLRERLSGFDLWILVLDTQGINVWCAAGKGTFGTQELVHRIASVKLAELVTHRTLILPQLGAPGVAAHQVMKMSGFKVNYGPVRAIDIPEYLNAGMKATPGMREVRFRFRDRLVLTPMELVGAFIPGLILWAVLFILNFILYRDTPFFQLLAGSLADFLPYLGAGFVGAVLVPALLPFIPGRALAWKGWLLGLLWAGVYLWLISPAGNWLHVVAYLLLLPSIASFLAMNFTGSTTYTSLSGVVKEMKFALPAQIISAGFGILLMIGAQFIIKN